MSSRRGRVRTGEKTVSQRAAEWYTSPWVVEWLDNTVQACTTSPGKEQFESWIIEKHGALAGRKLIETCNRRPHVSRAAYVPDCTPKTEEEKRTAMWLGAAAYYGVSKDTLNIWHEYSAENNLYWPERTKPPPKRRKAENSGQWMARVNAMLLEGHKAPVIDLDYARRTAIAEFDKTRDTLERMRTDPRAFGADIFERSRSIIPSPCVLEYPPLKKQWVNIDDAFRTRLNFLSMMHLGWRSAALLFEELAARGLNTPSAVERAYQRDSALMWRMVAAMDRIGDLHRKMWANFQQVIAASEYYRPLLKPWRDEDGLAHIEANRPAIHALMREGKFSAFDEFMIRAAEEVRTDFFYGIETCLQEDPSHAKKLSSEVYEAMGDLAAASEFQSQFSKTEFGSALVKHAAALERRTVGAQRAEMRSTMFFMDPDKVPPESPQYWDRVGEASRATRAMAAGWSRRVFDVSIQGVLIPMQAAAGPGGLDTRAKLEAIPLRSFNNMWKLLDGYLWRTAAELDRADEPGRVAREYGLWDANDPARPVASARGHIFKELELEVDQGARLEPKTTPAYVLHIPVAQAGESGAQSAHAYLANANAGAKEKVKTRGDASKKVDASGEDESDEAEPVLPACLPSAFKLGKKALKIFRRILEPPEEERDDAPAKGQVRWGDFENAMKRIGFEIIQTAGSSVRFDPPAMTARPITFHRPHPDSLLSPHAIKWLGARLKRTYGWTMGTFQRMEGEAA
ncbi:hypothetical protein MKEN_01461400 [Mycena kentingensis (nom. inval.)]|nr:hypothetical protein MKEN_01461400 [Mycena kentingensis (nom. inval.)]